MIYGSWDMKHNRHNFFSFWAIFCPFTSLTVLKIKIFKKRKKCLKILFYTCVPKIMIICYTVPEITCVTDVIVIFYCGLFFALLTPLKSKFKKNEKNIWMYHHFTHVYQKLWSDDIKFLRYGVRQTDSWTDGQTEKVTYRGGCPA